MEVLTEVEVEVSEAFEQRQAEEAKAAESDRLSDKPEKCSNQHTMHLVYNPKMREKAGGDFDSGEEIKCKFCKENIVISDGYFTCMDVCDFDVH